MPIPQSQTEYRSWPVDGLPLRVEFLQPVVEEIAAAAVDGLYRFRHGGVEVGGVLYGTVTRDAVRIAAFRPLECEHAFGPRFVLSEHDRGEMKRLVEPAGLDPVLRGLLPVGWYHSHTRSEIALSPRDIEIHERFFPHSSQLALVIRPENYESCRAGFFVRESNGRFHTGASIHEFAVRPRRHGLVAAESEPTPAPESAPAAEAPAPEAHHPPPPSASGFDLDASALALPSFDEVERTHSHRWLWLAAGLVCALLAGFAVQAYYGFTDTRPELNLWVADMGGQLLIEWDRTAKPVREARAGRLEIQDGQDRVTVPIPADRLREGSIDYVRRGDVLDVRLVLAQPGGKQMHEIIRFVGQPVNRPPSPEVADALRERDALKAEVEKLRAEVQKKTARRRTPRPKPEAAPAKP